jgi:predicted RNA-binding protein with TRAM domain
VVHPRVLALLAGAGGRRLEELEGAARRRFFLVPAHGNGHVHLDHFDIARQGKLDTVRPATPVGDGDEIELKLVEVGLHDPAAGVGKLEGDYEVVVAGASKLIGKKVKVSVGRALAGTAFATLADGQAVAASPITFEAEAEKPMRASRSKKEALEPAVMEAPEPDDEESEAVENVAEALADDGEPVAEGQPKKKRTRRGTRGGRARKKPDAAGTEGDGAVEAVDNGRPVGPRIHVPPLDLEATGGIEEPEGLIDALADVGAAEAPAAESDAPPKKKRSRRGSRGGRKRKKPAANGGEAAADSEVPETAEPPSDDRAAEYVPMSEWIEDFDASKRA